MKIGSVLTDVFGVSGQLMLDALLEGKATIEEVADLARHTARRKIPEIIQSLEGNRLDGHYRMLIKLSLEHLAFLEQQLQQIDAEILLRVNGLSFGRRSNCCRRFPVSSRTEPPAFWLRSVPRWRSFPLKRT